MRSVSKDTYRRYAYTYAEQQRQDAERAAIIASMPPEPDRPTLTPAEIRALPQRARVLVKWSGGNGPHLYELRQESFDALPPYTVMAWSIHENRPYGYPDQFHQVEPVLEWNHEEKWGERMLHKVWSADG